MKPGGRRTRAVERLQQQKEFLLEVVGEGLGEMRCDIIERLEQTIRDAFKKELHGDANQAPVIPLRPRFN